MHGEVDMRVVAEVNTLIYRSFAAAISPARSVPIPHPKHSLCANTRFARGDYFLESMDRAAGGTHAACETTQSL